MSEREKRCGTCGAYSGDAVEVGAGVNKSPMCYVIAPLSVDQSEIWARAVTDEDGRWIFIQRQDSADALTLSLAQAPWLVKALTAILEDET